MIWGKEPAISDFLTISPHTRLLGLDLGTKTIGLALSDLSLLIASPMETIKRRKFTQDALYLCEIIKKQEVGGLVLGLPIEMDGREGARCQSVRAFAHSFLKIQQIPIAFWDERLSTSAVQRMMTTDADLSRARRGELVDKLAASYILQGFLDARRRVL